MKHLYFLSFLLASCSLVSAQVTKGDVVVGGNIGYQDVSSSNSNVIPPAGYTSHNVNINPSIGKAIRENLVLGIDLGYSHGSNASVTGGQTEYSNANNAFSAGVFLRRYKPIGNGFYLFGQAEVGLGYSHSSSETPNSAETSDKSSGYSASLRLFPGIAYSLNHHWQIETGLPNFFVVNYTQSKETIVYTGQPEESGTDHYFDMSSSLTGNNQFTVGVRYFFGSF